MVENRCVFISWVSENKTKERDTYDCMGGGTSKFFKGILLFLMASKIYIFLYI